MMPTGYLRLANTRTVLYFWDNWQVAPLKPVITKDVKAFFFIGEYTCISDVRIPNILYTH